VLEASAIGLVAAVASLYIGDGSRSPTLATMFTLSGTDARHLDDDL
jgi:hypothetical protein